MDDKQHAVSSSYTDVNNNHVCVYMTMYTAKLFSYTYVIVICP